MAWHKSNAPTLLLGAALLAAAALLLVLGWDLTYFQDTWAVLLERPGWSVDSILKPHNEHLLAFQAVLQKLLIEIFGMDSAHPEMLVMTAALLAAGWLLFVYVRRRVGPWPALFAAVLLLFFGAAWQVLLWPFELIFPLPLAAGIGMLLMLEREDRRGDVFACLLLIVSVGFGSLGLSFAVAALVDVALKHRRRGWGRIWIALVPIALYGLWYLGWGQDVERHVTLTNVLLSPRYVFDGAAAAVGTLSGLDQIATNGLGTPTWGRPLLIALIGLAIFGLRRRPSLPETFWPVAAAALSYWLLAAFNYIPGREPASSRYVYAGAALVLLVAAELLRGVKFSSRALWIGGALTLIAIGPNLIQLRDGANWLQEQSVLTRADTAAIEIAERTVDPDFTLTPEIAGSPSMINIDAEEFLPAVREHGSPAYSPEELAEAPAVGRRQADIVLSQALPLETETVSDLPEGYVGPKGCLEVGAGAPLTEIKLSPGPTRIEVAPGPEAQLSLRRFATGEYPVPAVAAPGNSLTILRIPADKAPQPWYLLVQATQQAWVCP